MLIIFIILIRKLRLREVNYITQCNTASQPRTRIWIQASLIWTVCLFHCIAPFPTSPLLLLVSSPLLPSSAYSKVNLSTMYLSTEHDRILILKRQKAQQLNWNKTTQTLASLKVYKFHFINLYFHKWLPCQNYFISTKVRKIKRKF